jgi:Glycosyltransferase
MGYLLYYGNSSYPDKDASALRTIGNAKALRKIGYDVVLIGCRRFQKKPIMQSKDNYEGFDIYYYDEPRSFVQWKNYLMDFVPLKEVMREIKPERVVLYNHPSISSRRIISYCHKLGIKVYADCTEWYDPKGFSIHTAIKMADTWYRMRHVNKRLDGIIAISNFLRSYYQKSNIPVICVPPLIDITSLKWRPTEIKDAYNCSTKNLIYVGNPGTGAKDKLGLVISSLNCIRSSHPSLRFHLNIIGMTADQFLDVFRMDISECDFIDFMGRRPNEEALEMIKQSDYSIFLRDANLVCSAGFPTKFSESIACGTPVLTNLTSDLGIYLIDGKNGFVIDTTSFDTTCNSLYTALKVPSEQISEMKEYCRDDRSFDYHSFIEEFKKLF